MWEQIRANRRKSVLVIFLMAGVLIGLGYVIGMVAGGAQSPVAGAIGVVVAMAIWVVLCLTAFAGGDKIMLATAGARRIERKDLPQLCNVVEEMTIAAGLPKPPEIYVIESDSPNAFAVGKPERSAVAVTTGLLSRLNRDELQGVIAHEIGHIANYDCRFMVLAGVMVGAIVLLADVFLRSVFYGGGRSRRSSSKGSGQAEAIFFIAAIVAAILAPIFAHLLYLACSRKREYLADASAARFTRYPAGLASALQKIAGRPPSGKEKVSKVVAPMYIVNPLAARGGGRSSLWSTHPPIEQRVKVLRSMGGGASYTEYETAFQKVSGGAGVLGASALTDATEVPVREASAKPESPAPSRRREAMDALRQVSGFLFAQCGCGMRFKIPPGFSQPAVDCSSCGRTVSLKEASKTAPKRETKPKRAASPKSSKAPVRVRPQGKGKWRTVPCPCGARIPLSPGFRGARMHCQKCGQPIELEQ